jgi:hypothetical protein
VFVETILRYGLPADFTAVLIEVLVICSHVYFIRLSYSLSPSSLQQPAKKQDKKLRQVLDGLFKGIGSVYLQDDKDEEEEGEASHQLNEKFYSYVWTQIRVALT